MRDPHATLAALLRMTVDRGCTPHEAATAKERAKAIAERLGLTLETYVHRPEARVRRPEWAESAEAKSRARNEEFMRRQRAEQAERERQAREEFARARAERERAAASRHSLPPQQRRLLEFLMASSWSAAELGAILGGLEEHTVRAMISRLRKAGFEITRTKRARDTVYNARRM